MDPKQVCGILIGLLFCMSFTFEIAEGKCKGRFAVHYCMGGNKRSDVEDYNDGSSRTTLASRFIEKLLNKKIPTSLLREITRTRNDRLLSSDYSSEEERISPKGLRHLLNRLKGAE